MTKAFAEQFAKQNRTDFASQVSEIATINMKDVMPSAKALTKVINPQDISGSAFATGK